MTTQRAGREARTAIAAKVRGKAAEKNISIPSLAKAAHMDYSSMRRRITCDVDFTVTELIAIANALDADIAEFIPHTTAQAVAS